MSVSVCVFDNLKVWCVCSCACLCTFVRVPNTIVDAGQALSVVLSLGLQGIEDVGRHAYRRTWIGMS